MTNLAFELPINPVSFGMISIAILRELYRRNLQPCIFSIGNVDLSAQKQDKDFEMWLLNCLNKSHKYHKRTDKIFKLWHLSNLLSSYSEKQIALSFLETDFLTETEINVCNNQEKVYFTSNFAVNTFKQYGANNLEYLRLGFDSDNFYELNKKYYEDERCVWGIFGKGENRKRSWKTLNLWAKKYGNNKDHMLHCSIYNNFLNSQDNQNLIVQALEGKSYFNIVFCPYVKTNTEFCDIVNSIDIVLALSGGENFDMPVYSSVALGRHCLGLKAHAYLDYLNDQNSVLINPNSKIPSHDGLFFHNGNIFSQGNFFDWGIEDFNNGCDLIYERFKKNRRNQVGLELQKYTYKETVNTILEGFN
ncbi:MAG: hypothetical protein AABY22_30530 [Nanoarchaeota archaeon]